MSFEASCEWVIDNWCLVGAGVAVFIVFLNWLLVMRRRARFVMKLRGRVALVTGAGSGFGRQLTQDLLSAGVDVVLVDIRKEAAEETVKIAAKNLGRSFVEGHTWVFGCNCAELDDVAAMADKAKAAIGSRRHVSILVNNAGVVSGGKILDLDEKHIRTTLSVNTLAHFWTIKQFLPPMLKRNDGVVVTVSSMIGMTGGAALTDYAASKWAAMGLHESLRLEIDEPGSRVRALAICPFAANTGMFDGIFESSDTWMRKLLFPMLTASDVSQTIVRAIRNGYELATVPEWYTWMVPVCKIAPHWFMSYFLTIVGGKHGMNTFRGKNIQHAIGSGAADDKKAK